MANSSYRAHTKAHDLNCKIQVKRLPEKDECFIHLTTKREKANKKVSEVFAYRVIM